MTLVHEDADRARRAIGRCVDEIARLERIFSIYRPDSALSRLNARGELPDPPAELLQLLSSALALARASDGAFDPSIQPLYRLHVDHFAVAGADPAGPAQSRIERTLESVGFAAIELDERRIRLHRPSMALTLNGIAQGFITDRVADLLLEAGFRDVLIDLGEARAAGAPADGRAWRAAIADPVNEQRRLLELEMGEGEGRIVALATSAGYGTRFGPDPRVHHLLDPRTGRSANHHLSVSVAARRATIADGLSTALSIIAPASAGALLDRHRGARAWFVDTSRRISALPAA